MTDSLPEPPVGATYRTLATGRADLLVQEEPLLLVVHGQQLLTMRTPGRDQDLATGFLLGEGIIASADAVQSFTPRPASADGRTTEELHLTLASALGELARARLARTHEIRSSCGVCGLADAQSILEGAPPLLPGVPQLPIARIDQLVTALQSR
jgi:FdhD protein